MERVVTRLQRAEELLVDVIDYIENEEEYIDDIYFKICEFINEEDVGVKPIY